MMLAMTGRRIYIQNFANCLTSIDFFANQACLIFEIAKSRYDHQRDSVVSGRGEHFLPTGCRTRSQALHSADEVRSNINQFPGLFVKWLLTVQSVVSGNAEFCVKFA